MTGRNFVAYPDERLRNAIAHAVAKETGRGWRLMKDKRSSKIDAAVALCLACVGAEKEGPAIGDGADYVGVRNPAPSAVRTWVGGDITPGDPNVRPQDDPALARAYEAELRRSIVDAALARVLRQLLRGSWLASGARALEIARYEARFARRAAELFAAICRRGYPPACVSACEARLDRGALRRALAGPPAEVHRRLPALEGLHRQAL